MTPVGKAIPYGVYDVAANAGFVSVGTDHDTPVFAVTSIETWWEVGGLEALPESAQNLYHCRRGRLERGIDRTCGKPSFSASPTSSASRSTSVTSHRGTSKWNKIEHRLFSFITMKWRGRPLRSYETIVSLIGNTTTITGLVVRARIDRRKYPVGKKVSAKELSALKIERDSFHGDWNYVIRPRTATH